tara:strand:- start:908 stop:1099 length:192 start_codon:yes stop_codon:yes gene_type:complete
MMNLNYENWVKATYQHCDDPTEHDEGEAEAFAEEDVELHMCLEYLDEHNMMDDFLIWVNKNYK